MNFGGFDQPEFSIGGPQRQPMGTPQRQRPGGLFGFLRNTAESVADPFAYLLNSSIVNPTKELSAQVTGNKQALRNARRESNRELGLGESGGDLAGGLKKWAGNTAQVGSFAVPVGKAAGLGGKALQGAGSGALFSGGLSTKQGGSLEDVIADTLTGGAIGGGLGFAGGAVGKGLNKLGSKEGSKIAGKLSNTGQQMEARSGGFGVSSKQSGSAPLGLKESKSITQLLEKEGIKAGNPINRLGAVENKLQQYGKQIDDYLTSANRTLSEAERAGLADDFLKAIDNLPNVNKTVRNNAAQLADNLTRQSSDLKSLVNFRRGLDQDAISYIANPDAATAANQQAAKVLRKVISDKTGQLVPDIKAVNSTYAKLASARDYLIQGGKGVGNPSGGLISRVLESGPVQSLESSAGKATRKTADAVNAGVRSLPQAPSGASDAIARGLTFGAIDSSLQPQQEQPAGLEDALLGLGGSPQTAGNNPFLEGQSGGAQQQPQTSPYTRENLMADIQRDPQNAGDYIAYFQSLQEVFAAPEQTGPELNNTAIGTISDFQTGIDNLNLLQQNIEQSGANAPILGSLRSRNPFDTDAKGLRAEIDRVKQVVGKALEGGVLRKEDEEKYARILPTISDTDEVAATKINAIRNDLQNKLNTFYQNSVQFGGGGGTLENAIMAAQQQTGGYR